MKTILIIESHEMMRLFLLNLLSKDHEVVAVANLEEADFWLANHEADLIIGDYSSSDLMEQKEAESSWLVLTDQDKSQQRIEVLQKGAKDCISKPFNPIELQLRVNGHLASAYASNFTSVAKAS